jgi:peptidoglycan hydrolase CwlO-like protein
LSPNLFNGKKLKFDCTSKDFLAELRKVKESLDGIQNDVSSMNNMVKEMKLSLNSTKTKTHNLIEQTTRLKSER